MKAVIRVVVVILLCDPGVLFAGCSGTGNGGDGMQPDAALTCRGGCQGSACDQAVMENPTNCFYWVCSCSETSECDCCHLILKTDSTGNAKNGRDTAGDCPSCSTTGGCTHQSMGDSTQAVCQQIEPR